MRCFVCARLDLPVVSNYWEGSSVKRMLGVLLTMSAICWAQDTGPLNGLATLHSGATSERASSWDRSGGTPISLW